MTEFFSHTKHYVELQQWLGLRYIVQPQEYPHFTTLPHGYPEMDTALAEQLKEYYAPHDEKLKVLLNRKELPW
jgi:hypothetical protein